MGQVAPRRRRWPTALVAFLVVLAGLALGADLIARAAAQKAVADQVKASSRARSVSVHMNWFPFLWDAALNGRVNRVTVIARGVPVGPARLDQVTVQGYQVDFNTSQLFNSQTLKVTSIDRGTVTIHVTGMQAAAVKALEPELTSVPLIPDCPLNIQPAGSGYDLSCTVSPVPASVLAAINSRAA